MKRAHHRPVIGQDDEGKQQRLKRLRRRRAPRQQRRGLGVQQHEVGLGPRHQVAHHAAQAQRLRGPGGVQPPQVGGAEAQARLGVTAALRRLKVEQAAGTISPLRLTIKMDINPLYAYYYGQMNDDTFPSLLERQLLLQLGDRLTRLRKAQGIGTVEMAKRVGISRTTLSAVESGDPAPSMGTYLKVMSALGVSGELALLAGDVLQPAPSGSAAAKSRLPRPTVQILVSADESKHRVQDLQSLALHTEAVRLARDQPELLEQARATLERWISAGNTRSMDLWLEWRDILNAGAWRKVLSRTRRGQALRQASPLTPLLPQATRQAILSQVNGLKKSVRISSADELAPE